MKKKEIEKKEIEFIGTELYRETQERKKNGSWTQNDLQMEQNLYKELNALGFNFSWHMQLSPKCFTKKDKAIVPIFMKYYGKFDRQGLNTMCIYCLSVRGLDKSVDFLLDQIRKTDPTVGPEKRLLHNYLCNALYQIRDPKHADDYVTLISNHNDLFPSTSLIVLLIGKLKIKKAIPYLVDILNCESRADKTRGPDAVKPECIEALGWYKDPSLSKYIEKYVTDEDVVIRQEAQKALKRLKI